MKRSPLVVALLLALSAPPSWPQTDSSQSASGTPKAPLAGTQVSGPQANLSSSSGQSASTRPAQNAPTPADDLIIAPIIPLPDSRREVDQPMQPKTEILDNSAAGPELTTEGHDPILDPPSLPGGTTTLVGGIVTSVDHIRNTVTINVFGGNRWKIFFDERTHIFQNGAETTQLAIKKGARVYIDTMLDTNRHDVFARNIRVGTTVLSADADGQIVNLDEGRGIVVLQDSISSTPVELKVDAGTRIVHGNTPVSLRELKPGSLAHVRFSPEQSNRGLAHEIVLVAVPGSAFTYIGRITYLDMRRGILAMQDSLDRKSYEIHFDIARNAFRNDLSVGAEVRIEAIFEGNRYDAQSIHLTKSAQATDQEKQ